jgi:hypothetical protein
MLPEEVKTVRDAMACWMDKMADRRDDIEVNLHALVDAQMAGTADMRAAVADLARTVEWFQKARSNGGGNWPGSAILGV